MTWYKSPVQPIDPVSVSQQPKPPIRYVRDNFSGTGQNSHEQPPTQDQSMWQALTNVMPITKGSLDPRWGFGPLCSGLPTDPASRLFNFQSDATGARSIIATAPYRITTYDESGNQTNFNIFTPTAGKVVRAINSRNYEYFCDGSSADSQKWDGQAATTTNWGINSSDVTANISGGGGTTSATLGPRLPTVATDVTYSGASTWSSVNNIKADDGNTATAIAGSFSSITRSVVAGYTDYIRGTGFGFSSSGTISGIKVDVKCSASKTNGTNMAVRLLKAGALYGTVANLVPGTTSAYISAGGVTNLWGGTWTAADINNANFGVSIQCYGSLTSFTIDAVRVTVYVTVPASGSSSGSGVSVTATSTAGAVTLTMGRIYYLTFYNSATGHFSDLTTPSGSTGAITSKQVSLELATSNDPQVTHKYLLATADGGDPSILYIVAELTNATASVSDNTPETTLINNQPLLFTDTFGNEFGVSLNDPPPPGTLAIKHKGRIWMAGVPGATHSIFFSKSVSELTLPNGFIAGKYEEAWPGNNYFDVSDGAEAVSGLLSDGVNLYIGTQNHIRRFIGDSPDNFQAPEIVHPQVGVLNQETWQLVFAQGTPAGAIWMTPDFRVMQSDFNTYVDIGTPVQNILNNLQSTAAQLAHAMFVSDGEFELYILAVPYLNPTTCDLHLVFDIRNRQWFVWSPSDGSASYSMLFNITAAGAPQWLWLDTLSDLMQYAPTFTSDNGTPIVTTATTTWLHLGEATRRKILDEITIYGDHTMTVNVSGANNEDDFAAPSVVASGLTLRQSPFGQWVAYLYDSVTRHTYYQFTFTSSANAAPFLGAYSIASTPLSDV